MVCILFILFYFLFVNIKCMNAFRPSGKFPLLSDPWRMAAVSQTKFEHLILPKGTNSIQRAAFQFVKFLIDSQFVLITCNI